MFEKKRKEYECCIYESRFETFDLTKAMRAPYQLTCGVDHEKTLVRTKPLLLFDKVTWEKLEGASELVRSSFYLSKIDDLNLDSRM